MIITKNMIAAEAVPEKDLWGTPDPIYNKLNKTYGFTLDPCCTTETAKCPTYFTPKENGLIQSWAGHTVFANPPYSRGNIDKWINKFIIEASGATIIALLPVSTSADWFQRIIGNTLYFVDKRIKFKGAKYTAPFSSVIVSFNNVNKVFTFRQEK